MTDVSVRRLDFNEYNVQNYGSLIDNRYKLFHDVQDGYVGFHIYEFANISPEKDINEFMVRPNHITLGLDDTQYKHVRLEREMCLSIRGEPSHDAPPSRQSFTRTFEDRAENIRNYIDPNNQQYVRLKDRFIYQQIGVSRKELGGHTVNGMIAQNDILFNALEIGGYAFLIIDDFENGRLPRDITKLILVEVFREPFTKDKINWRIPLSYALIGITTNENNLKVNSSFLFGIWTSAYGRLRYYAHDRAVRERKQLMHLTLSNSSFPRGLGIQTLKLGMHYIKYNYPTNTTYIILEAKYSTRRAFLNQLHFFRTIPIYRIPFEEVEDNNELENYDPMELYVKFQEEEMEGFSSIPVERNRDHPSNLSMIIADELKDIHFIYEQDLIKFYPRIVVVNDRVCVQCGETAKYECKECNVLYCKETCFYKDH